MPYKGASMTTRVFTIAAIATLALSACLALSGCADGMDEDTRKSVGLALGLIIVAASGIGLLATNSRFKQNKNRRIRQYRSRSNTKSRKRK